MYYVNFGDASSVNLFKSLFYDMNWLFFCGWMLLFCVIVLFIVSMCTEAPTDEKIKGLVFGTSTPEQIAETRQSWTKWDVINSIIILAITAGFYIYFW